MSTDAPTMTLLDLFAANAPKPPRWWIAGYPSHWKKADSLKIAADHRAAWAYSYAHAMMAARNKPPMTF